MFKDLWGLFKELKSLKVDFCVCAWWDFKDSFHRDFYGFSGICEKNSNMFRVYLLNVLVSNIKPLSNLSFTYISSFVTDQFNFLHEKS